MSELPLGPLPRRALVTGASGYFGGVLARHLADRGVAVVGLDRLDDPEPDPRIVAAKADLLDVDALARVVAGPPSITLRARRAFGRLSLNGRLVRALPAASAFLILAVGIGITVNALPEVL